jgi:hypothetical protein
MEQTYRVEADGEATLIADESSSSGMDAVLAGTAELNSKGCWSLRDSGSGEVVLVVWPEGTRLIDGRVSLSDGATTIGAGDFVEGTGGELPIGNYAALDERCGDATSVLRLWRVSHQ